jgi:hypothetical protein
MVSNQTPTVGPCAVAHDALVNGPVRQPPWFRLASWRLGLF